MDNIEILVISKENIKPSSPTPKAQSKHHLSFLDQIAPPVLMPLIYFYPADNISNSEKSYHLKKSLSQVLSRYYPLAGRYVDDLYIVDCNDHGAPFIEAEANCNLSDMINDPLIPRNMNKFLPCKLDGTSQNMCMAVQVTFFQCGGLAIGIALLHKVGDALSVIQFVNTWAAMTRNGNTEDIHEPKFGGAVKDFPPRDLGEFKRGAGIVKEQVTKIFKFPASRISALQDRYSSSGDRRASRVEALSAFMWTRLISSTESIKVGSENKVYTVVQPVNLRTRLDPPLSEYHFGNIILSSIATPTVGDSHCELLQKLREAVKGVNGDYVDRLKEPDVHLNFIKDRMARGDKGEVVTFTSLCRFPLYEADFGWGKPGRVGLAEYRGNLVVFMDTATGGGIEAWAHLNKEKMEKFEADLELQ